MYRVQQGPLESVVRPSNLLLEAGSCLQLEVVLWERRELHGGETESDLVDVGVTGAVTRGPGSQVIHSGDWRSRLGFPGHRLVHLDVEDCSEKLLRQQSYAIKNQLGHPKPPTRGILFNSRWFFMAQGRL